jgi:hypothetical protein
LSCPDEGKIKLNEGKIDILEKVFFKNSPTAPSASGK